MNNLISKRVNIGPSYKLDKGVIIGYLPSRKIKSRAVYIGKKALIRSGTVIYAGTRIGDNLETGHNIIIREMNIIGDDFKIWSNSVIDYGCRIGNRVRIHSNVYLAQYTIIEDDVFLGPGTITANDPHPICTKCMKGPTIKRGVKVGINATLLSHIVIGEDSLIGAGSVVTKDIPPRSVAYGNPAKVVKTIDELKCSWGIKEKVY